MEASKATVVEGADALPSDHDRYRYDRFTTRLLLDDLTFGRETPAAGDRFPHFDLETTDGPRFKYEDVVGDRPLMLVFGSATCPMTASAAPSLSRLHEEFGDRVTFALIYVREAHPGERYTQPATVEEKREHARALQERDGVSWTVAVDDVDGSLHRALDTKPNAAYLVDREGRIAYRSIWASDEGGLRNALAAVARGDAPPKRESRAMMLPMLRALGRIDDVIRSAGRQAQRDMWRANTPMALAGRVSSLFRPLAPDTRGYATAAAFLAAGAAAALMLLRLVA